MGLAEVVQASHMQDVPQGALFCIEQSSALHFHDEPLLDKTLFLRSKRTGYCRNVPLEHTVECRRKHILLYRSCADVCNVFIAFIYQALKQCASRRA